MFRPRLLSAVFFIGVFSATAVLAVSVAPRGTQPQGTAADVDLHKAFGSKSASITMEVFSDFQCPACRTLYLGVWRQLMENYVNTGKVYLIHRNFPLAMHAHSRDAARYADAAARLGKFEAVEQVLFEKQESWAASGDVDGTVAKVLAPADMARVRALVKGGTLDAGIDRDFALGQSRRVTQTPTTIITHKGQTYPVVGPQSYAVFHEFLDQLLSQK